MKRSRPRNKSTKQAQMERDHRKARSLFRSEFPACWFCGQAAAHDTHELTANGGCRSEAYGERCCWGAACRQCNCFELTDKRKWPIARQLAVKWIRDQEWVDLERVNHVRRGLPQTSWADVVIWICKEID